MKKLLIASTLVLIVILGFWSTRSQPSQPTSTATPLPNATVSAKPSPTISATSFTAAQVAQHNSAASCYTIINASVYDLTSFVSQHPGGDRAILSICGVDGTASFEQQHGGSRRQETLLAPMKIGVLVH